MNLGFIGSTSPAHSICRYQPTPISASGAGMPGRVSSALPFPGKFWRHQSQTFLTTLRYCPGLGGLITSQSAGGEAREAPSSLQSLGLATTTKSTCRRGLHGQGTTNDPICPADYKAFRGRVRNMDMNQTHVELVPMALQSLMARPIARSLLGQQLHPIRLVVQSLQMWPLLHD